jgi:hypothetical protein
VDEEKIKKFVKADDKWGPIYADKDSLISRCVDVGNRYSNGEFLYSILYFRLNGPMAVFYVQNTHSVPFFMSRNKDVLSQRKPASAGIPPLQLP